MCLFYVCDLQYCLRKERFDTEEYCEILDEHVLNFPRHRPMICKLHVPPMDFTLFITHHILLGIK